MIHDARLKLLKLPSESLVSKPLRHRSPIACSSVNLRFGPLKRYPGHRHDTLAENRHPWMEVSEARRLRTLEEENRQLKHIVAEQAVDIRALKAVVAKKW
jgi:hypothetical protein